MKDLQTLKTPSLILDVERVRKNAAKMKNLAAKNNVRLRPHIKTHKCTEVARLQTPPPHAAVTVSTLAEARAFAAAGFTDLTYAVPIEPGKFGEAVEIIRRDGVKLNLLTDDPETVGELDRAAGKAGVRFEVFLKIDCGYHRCGVEPHTRAALEIPEQITAARNLNFAGILTHAGHSYDVRTLEEVEEIARQERDKMVALAENLRRKGIEVPCVSIGSTPTMSRIDDLAGVTEIRPGNYIFFDGFQATLGTCGFEDCALTVLTAVTHRSRDRKKIIIDAGAIALSKDRGAVQFEKNCGYGKVLDLEGTDLGLSLEALSQEHGAVRVSDEAVLEKLKVGTRLRILANHSCLTAAQHRHYNVLENGTVVAEWQIRRGW